MPGTIPSNAATTSRPQRTSRRLNSVAATSPAARPQPAIAPTSAFGHRESRLTEWRGLTFWGQWLVAISLQLLLLCTLALLKTGELDTHYRATGVFLLLASVPAYSLMRVYHKQHGYLMGLSRLLAAWLILLASLIAAAFVTKTSELFSREVILTWSLLGFVLQAASYVPLHHLSRRYQQSQQATHTSLIIGTGELAMNLADKLVRHKQEPLLGLVTSSDELPPDNSLYPIIGSVAHLRDLIASLRIRRLYIALQLAEAELVEGLYIDLLDANVDVVWIPDLQSLTLLNHSVSEIEGMPAIHLNESPLTTYPTAAATKALLDRAIALVAILALSPLLLATAIAVKLSSPGPVLFKQKRHGWNGTIIKVWKFRSMRLHNDADVKQARRDDQRITRVGRFIRRTSIDELPQLFNVLQGSMSLVGPRPHAVAHNDYYTGKIDAYMARHRIKPGMTGLAQVSGCRGETETLDKMERRVELDLAYINSWSLWLDIKILIKTPFTLLGKDIY